MNELMLMELIEAKNQLEESFDNLNKLLGKIEKLEKDLGKSDDRKSSDENGEKPTNDIQGQLNNFNLRLMSIENKLEKRPWNEKEMITKEEIENWKRKYDLIGGINHTMKDFEKESLGKLKDFEFDDDEGF